MDHVPVFACPTLDEVGPKDLADPGASPFFSLLAFDIILVLKLYIH